MLNHVSYDHGAGRGDSNSSPRVEAQHEQPWRDFAGPEVCAPNIARDPAGRNIGAGARVFISAVVEPEDRFSAVLLSLGAAHQAYTVTPEA